MSESFQASAVSDQPESESNPNSKTANKKSFQNLGFVISVSDLAIPAADGTGLILI
jgi:hypothetical protein